MVQWCSGFIKRTKPLQKKHLKLLNKTQNINNESTIKLVQFSPCVWRSESEEVTKEEDVKC